MDAAFDGTSLAVSKEQYENGLDMAKAPKSKKGSDEPKVRPLILTADSRLMTGATAQER